MLEYFGSCGKQKRRMTMWMGALLASTTRVRDVPRSGLVDANSLQACESVTVAHVSTSMYASFPQRKPTEAEVATITMKSVNK
jgi:hypothetical protein